MSDMEIIKIVFGIFLSIGMIVIFFIAFKLYYKYLILDKKCNKKTMGIVKRYTMATRGGENSGICLPVVFYNVDGKEYKVVGPEYRGYKIINVSTPLSNNEIYECNEDEKGNLIVKRKNNSFINIKSNPMEKMYPKGTELEVYYCEEKPKLSYVLRNLGNNKWKFYLSFFAGIFVMLFDIYVIFILK